MKTRGKEKINLLANGQKITPEIASKWLKDDLIKAQYTIHFILEHPQVIDLLAQDLVKRASEIPVNDIQEAINKQKEQPKSD